MADVRVLVLRTAGINCDEEIMHCWRLAGAAPSLVHLNMLSKTPSMLDDFDVVTLPGGFSYGDDVGAGQILAQRILLDLAEHLRRLVQRGGGILGICNGFQALVKSGLLPGFGDERGLVTITYNDSAKFEARWVKLEVATDRCVFLKPGTHLELPVEHAEGKVVAADGAILTRLVTKGHVAVRYVDENGDYDKYPANPNGSDAGIAGLCDRTGRIFGLMPHPDRHFNHTHRPDWTRRRPEGTPDGLTVFQNAVAHWGG